MKKIAAFISVLTLGACQGTILGEEVTYDEETAAVTQSAKDVKPKDGELYAVQNEYGHAAETPIVDESLWQEIVTPEVYAIIATRATNKMLDETSYIYDQRPAPKLYVKDVKAGDEMPSGFYIAKKTVKQIIEGSRTFTLVNNVNDADYTLDIEVNKLDVPGYKSPIIQYKAVLMDDFNDPVKEWIETIQKVDNDDKTWW